MDEVLRASLTVGSALHAVRTGRGDGAIVAVLDQAGAAVRDLGAGPYGRALYAVLDEVERCHRAGRGTSPGLEAAIEAALTALDLQATHHQS